MENSASDPHSLEFGMPWMATSPAIEVSFEPGAGGDASHKVLASLTHPTYPFVHQALSGGALLTDSLRELAEAYLARVQQSIPEARAFAKALWEGAANCWAWYDLSWGANDLTVPEDPRLSFWAGLDETGAPTSRTAVLLAGPLWRPEAGPQHVPGGGEGLRVVIHIDPPDIAGKHFARITASTFANPPTPKSRESENFIGEGGPLERLSTLLPRIAARLGPVSDIKVREFAVSFAGVGRVAGHARAGSELNPRVVSWALRVTADGAGLRFHDEYRVELVTHATEPIKAFDRDPASSGAAKTMVKRRPTRNVHVLNPFLQPIASRLPPKKLPSDLFIDLIDQVDPPRVTVQGTHLAQNSFDAATVPQRVPTQDLALRSDDQAAVHAYLRGRELMDRLEGSGLTPETYFRFAKLPLVMRHHAAMARGNPDGHSVNAQVQPLSPGQAFTDPFDRASRPQLEVRFGAANLAHREVGSAFHGRRRPQYMGLAADRRWSWHEFGHVLSWAATGDLEFPFAHSAGDALAAILNDPDSELVHDGTNPAKRGEFAAGLTFPWVPIKRRHDRDASLGWCWCGRRNTRRLSPLPPGARVFTGYFAEQLLSTTLFRVYRALGGDSMDAAPRHKAADYTAFLIMRATQLLGPATCVAAQQATHFFNALVQADIATSAWHYPIQRPASAPGAVRIGGMAHKVIRWAFEQQGLFADETPGEVVEGIGRPPEVDVHVSGDGAATDGGYGPHALDWTDVPGAPTPGWHASPQGLAVQPGPAGNVLSFTVRNRGSLPAADVQASVWVAPAVAGAALLAWEFLTPTQPPMVGDIAPGKSMTFIFAASLNNAPLNGAYFVLASASCRDDRSNLDPLAALPCAGTPPSEPRQVAELVAGDNNIGLVLLDLQ